MLSRRERRMKDAERASIEQAKRKKKFKGFLSKLIGR
jgi:hypothetical protein